GAPALFLHGPLGRRECLEPPVGDRLAAVDRQTVRPVREPLLGASDGRELTLQILDPARVELVLVEVLRVLVARLEALVALERAGPLKYGEALLDPRPLAGQ